MPKNLEELAQAVKLEREVGQREFAGDGALSDRQIEEKAPRPKVVVGEGKRSIVDIMSEVKDGTEIQKPVRSEKPDWVIERKKSKGKEIVQKK